MSSCNIIQCILLILLLGTIVYYYYDRQHLNLSKSQSKDSKNVNSLHKKNDKMIEKYTSPLHSYYETRSRHDNLSVPCPPAGCDVTELKPNVCLEKYCQQTNNQPEPRKPCIPNSYDVNCPRVNIWESPMCNIGL